MTRLMNAALILTCALFILSFPTTMMRGQTSQNVRYPTMLDMTFPEFEAAVKKTDIVLLPIGAIEERGYLPLGTDAMNAVAQLFQVQDYLRKDGVDTILGPSLNIGITNEADDWSRDGTYVYSGSLTISKGAFVALYLDVLRSLYDNGLRRAFLYLGHLGARHVEAVVQIAEEANRRITGMAVYALIDSEMLERMKRPADHAHPVRRKRALTSRGWRSCSEAGRRCPARHMPMAQRQAGPSISIRRPCAPASNDFRNRCRLPSLRSSTRRPIEEPERQRWVPIRQSVGSRRQADRGTRRRAWATQFWGC